MLHAACRVLVSGAVSRERFKPRVYVQLQTRERLWRKSGMGRLAGCTFPRGLFHFFHYTQSSFFNILSVLLTSRNNSSNNNNCYINYCYFGPFVLFKMLFGELYMMRI